MRSLPSTILVALAAACTTPNPDYRPHGGPCTTHRQCESNVCLPEGKCSDGVDVAFVDPGGEGTSCSLSSPCSAIEAALKTGRSYLKMTGTTKVTDTVAITGKKLTVLADSGAKLTRDTPGTLVKVTDSSQVAIFDLEISGARGPEGIGIWMPTANNSNVSLERVTVGPNAREGIKIESTGVMNISQSTITGNYRGLVANGSIVNVRQSVIRNSLVFGIYANNSAVQIMRSTIENNGKGGLVVFLPTEFQIANNFIVQNGNEPSPIGGITGLGAMYIKIDPGTSARKLMFNTIADNNVEAGQQTGGVTCFGDVQTANNLIYRNALGVLGSQTDGDCTYGSSLITGSDPGFRSATDYHLTAATPAGTIRDAFDCASSEDIDGDARPQGGKCDLGADEYRGP